MISKKCCIAIILFLPLFLSCNQEQSKKNSDTILIEVSEDRDVDLYKMACVDTVKIRKERVDKIVSLKKEIYSVANENLNKRSDKIKPEDVMAMMMNFATSTNMFQRSLALNEEIIKAAQEKMSGFDKDFVSEEIVSEIKKYVTSAIEDSSFLDESTKKQMKEVILNVKVGNFDEYVEKNNLKTNMFSQAFMNYCGADGLLDNAFAMKTKEESYVLICPGWLISNNEASSKKDKLEKIFHVLAHEISHHVDSESFATSYNVLVSHHVISSANELSLTDEDSKLCKDDEKQCAKLKVSSHLSEIVADYWAQRAISLYLSDRAKTKKDDISFYVSNYMGICDSTDDGIHPSDKFRINQLLQTLPF